ncbi:hypothetical protein B9K05_08660 [Acetobacter syzygii]|uniref:Uncharacterized protein n=1 Tax=Acetobacter syzygii TaxID=146476 RepID=A0A270BIB1_9PROT|nr:hypothetical protein B9K05_08660 [Acetobacter syzygii]PAL24873.1 hypothetical protein B9K04_08150 [Acetobacter syzygii]
MPAAHAGEWSKKSRTPAPCDRLVPLWGGGGQGGARGKGRFNKLKKATMGEWKKLPWAVKG